MKVEYAKGERASLDLVQLHRHASAQSGGRKAKVMVVFPPDWYPSEPYLSLPTLTSVLRAAGHQVV
ncbi:MAG: B12-binding domain-containing radical SAM protein, partial [Nitrospiraceae bacterium]